jgi:dihydroxyacetone kinase-like predicted kinase
MECSFAFDPDLSAQVNSEMLVDVMGSVKTILIFPAARSIEINGVSAIEGQPVAMLDSELIMSATTNLELLVQAIGAAGGEDSDQITVFLGNRLDELDLDSIRDFLESSFGDLEQSGIELHWGGQPNYDFMVSVVSS